MERVGIRVNVEHLRKAQTEAEQDLKVKEEKFIKWV